MAQWRTGTKIFWISISIVLAWTAWWWIESATSCEHQDQYTLRGFCLMQERDLAEKGDINSQWFYGDYLVSQGQKEETYVWHRKAMAQVRIGFDLRDNMDVYCRYQVPGFESALIEATMQRVAATSPDAHLRLLQLYLKPYPTCPTFDLDKASAQIPLLTQCAHLTLEKYFEEIKKSNYAIKPAVRAAIKANLALCAKEVIQRPANGPYVVEFIPVQQKDIDALYKSLDVLGPADPVATRPKGEPVRDSGLGPLPGL